MAGLRPSKMVEEQVAKAKKMEGNMPREREYDMTWGHHGNLALTMEKCEELPQKPI